jgi:hypothetical protein
MYQNSLIDPELDAVTQIEHCKDDRELMKNVAVRDQVHDKLIKT